MALNSHGLNLMGDYPMKLSHLLTGAAVAALTAGAAVAQVPAAQQPRVTVGAIITGDGAEDFAATQAFASEVNLAALTTKVDGNFEAQVDLTPRAPGAGVLDTLGAADKFTVTFTLTGGLTFDAQVTDGDHLGDNGAAPAPATACDMVVQSGGAVGDTTVTFVSNVAASGNCDDDAEDLLFDFDIQVTDAGNFTVSVDQVGGGNLYSETYDAAPTTVASTALVTRASGFAVTVTPDGADTFADADTAGGGTAGVRFDSLEGGGLIGQVSFANPTGALIDFGTAFDATAATLSNAVVTLTMPSATSFTSATFGPGGAKNFGAGNSVSVSLAGGDLAVTDVDAGSAITITLTDDGNVGTPIAFQTPTVSVDLTGGTNVTLADKSGPMETIELENTSVGAPAGGGAFQWVGDGGNVDSIFRCQVGGVGAASPRVFAILTNATNNNEGTFDLGNIGTSGGELIVTSDMIAAVSGPFSRADVNIAVADPTTIAACDRLMASPAGTLSDFSADYN